MDFLKPKLDCFPLNGICVSIIVKEWKRNKINTTCIVVVWSNDQHFFMFMEINQEWAQEYVVR